MSKKNYDNHNRWRNKTVLPGVGGGRSPARNLVKLTG